MEWHPHVTVATLVENDGKFLFVEEIKHGRKVLNQPAGHLEENESLIEAALRETLEETQWRVEILGVVGTSFFARPIAFCPEQKLDIDIEQAIWLTPDELRERRGQLRSPLVLECLERYLQGQRHPLSMIY